MRYLATVDGAEHELEVDELDPDSYRVRVGEQEFQIDLRRVGAASFSIVVDHRSFDLEVSRDGGDLLVASRHGSSRVTLIDRARRALSAASARQLSGRVEMKAMMPGRVIGVLVEPGQEVQAGQGVLIVEAMKMENELKSPKTGKVLEVKVAAGQTVEKGDLLVVIE